MHKKVRSEFGLFALEAKLSPIAIKDQSDMGAITWCYIYGQPFKHIQPLAIKILSQVIFCLFNMYSTVVLIAFHFCVLL